MSVSNAESPLWPRVPTADNNLDPPTLVPHPEDSPEYDPNFNRMAPDMQMAVMHGWTPTGAMLAQGEWRRVLEKVENDIKAMQIRICGIKVFEFPFTRAMVLHVDGFDTEAEDELKWELMTGAAKQFIVGPAGDSAKEFIMGAGEENPAGDLIKDAGEEFIKNVLIGD